MVIGISVALHITLAHCTVNKYCKIGSKILCTEYIAAMTAIALYPLPLSPASSSVSSYTRPYMVSRRLVRKLNWSYTNRKLVPGVSLCLDLESAALTHPGAANSWYDNLITERRLVQPNWSSAMFLLLLIQRTVQLTIDIEHLPHIFETLKC